MSFIRIGVRHKAFRNFTRYAHVTADGRGQCYEHFDSRYQMNLENAESENPIINKETFENYKCPKLCLKYSPENCVQHAISGITESHPKAHQLINKESNNLQVLPSFLLPFSNAIMLGLGPKHVMLKDRTVHAESFVIIFQPLKPQGSISYELKVLDIIDKGKGTVYVNNLYGRDEAENDIFLIEYQFYEIGTTGFVKKGSEKTIEKIIAPPERDPDQIFEFKTKSLPPNFVNPSPDDMKVSSFSPNHWRQYHDVTEKFLKGANCHGRYYLGAVIQQILTHFAKGDTRFSYPVFPGNTLVTKTWKIKERIHFETFAKETGKRVLQASYLDLKPTIE